MQVQRSLTRRFLRSALIRGLVLAAATFLTSGRRTAAGDSLSADNSGNGPTVSAEERLGGRSQPSKFVSRLTAF